MVFTVRRASPLPPERAWRAVTDFARHARYVPFTTVSTEPGDPHVGWRFVGVTGARRLGFSDPMHLTAWEPPHRFRMVKTGWLLAGWAEVVLEDDGGGGSVLTWTEEISAHAGPASSLTRRAGDLVAPRMFAVVVDGLLRDAEAEDR
jgi:uncharacterized protein YndB with AHSA1/START domain